MYEEILQAIIAYWKQVIDDDTIQVLPESNLMDDLALSSLEMFNSLLTLEDEYGISIPERALRRMITIKDVAQVLAEIIQREKR